MLVSKGDLKDSSFEISDNTSSAGYFIDLQPMLSGFVDNH